MNKIRSFLYKQWLIAKNEYEKEMFKKFEALDRHLMSETIREATKDCKTIEEAHVITQGIMDEYNKRNKINREIHLHA